MKLAILSATIGAACAFAPSASRTATAPALRMSTESPEESAPAIPVVKAINGWVPDKSLPCYGLPGAIGPFGFFDPAGFTDGMELSEVKRFREAEVMHGRVAMMAVLGYIIGESTPTITYGMSTAHTIANNQLPEVSSMVLLPFFLAINIAEAFRASKGWVEPSVRPSKGWVAPNPGTLFTLRESYYPGDLGFDPLSLKSTDKKVFANQSAKELSNGRLAMLAVAGFCAQEQINGQGILENLGF
jgi:hypothetical protein